MGNIYIHVYLFILIVLMQRQGKKINDPENYLILHKKSK